MCCTNYIRYLQKWLCPQWIKFRLAEIPSIIFFSTNLFWLFVYSSDFFRMCIFLDTFLVCLFFQWTFEIFFLTFLSSCSQFLIASFLITSCIGVIKCNDLEFIILDFPLFESNWSLNTGFKVLISEIIKATLLYFVLRNISSNFWRMLHKCKLWVLDYSF